MFNIPPIPAWNALHVLVIHFPIALLIAAFPVLLLAALVWPKTSRQFAVAAGLMLVLGTAACYLATQTGEAAEHLANQQGARQDHELHEAIETHSHYGETARDWYTYFSVVFLLYLLVPVLTKKELPAGVNAALLVLFLVASGVCALVLANTAHAGGLLVHEHGLTAPLGNSQDAAGAAQGGDSGDSAGPDSDSGAAANQNAVDRAKSDSQDGAGGTDVD
jgi:uncharacterized membrane protein